MALINCPECNKEISDKVKSCPNCGYPLAEELKADKETKKGKKKKLAIFSILFGIVVIVAVTSVIIINNNKLAKIEQENYEINELISETMDSITSSGDYAYESCSIILEVWSNARNRNFNRVFRHMFSGDLKNNQYSGLGMDENGFSWISWGELADKMNSFHLRLDRLDDDKEKVDNKLDLIRSIENDNFENEIEATINYYNSYLKLYNAATNPSGNQLNYSSELIDMNNEYNGNKVELEMLVD